MRIAKSLCLPNDFGVFKFTKIRRAALCKMGLLWCIGFVKLYGPIFLNNFLCLLKSYDLTSTRNPCKWYFSRFIAVIVKWVQVWNYFCALRKCMYVSYALCDSSHAKQRIIVIARSRILKSRIFPVHCFLGCSMSCASYLAFICIGDKVESAIR